MRVGYKIVEAGAGGEIKGDTVLASKTIRQSGSLQVDNSDVINELLDDAAGQLAATIVQSAGSLPTTVAKDKMVSFNIACSMTDPRQQPILISAVSVSGDGKLIATNPPAVVQPLDVTVELDGLAIGSAPGEFQAYPGMHKLRLSREGFEPWERTVNIFGDQTLRVALQMSAAGYARWADTTAFLATLDNRRKLTDAEVAKINGLAKFYSESHYAWTRRKMSRSTKAFIRACFQNVFFFQSRHFHLHPVCSVLNRRERESRFNGFPSFGKPLKRLNAPAASNHRAEARCYSESHCRVDTKENVQINKSLY